ncbi:MAG: hypothetical protein JWM78_1615 [Verrucomicrobiaceae bacterium]|nr:hypothetical protein [Verrucomicrobiaceae bacterium]
MILIDVKLTAITTEREQLIALLEQTMAGSQREPGCLVYRFTADLGDPLTFYLLELWEDEAALADHFNGEHFANFIKQMPQLGRVESSLARNGDLQPYKIQR